MAELENNYDNCYLKFENSLKLALENHQIERSKTLSRIKKLADIKTSLLCEERMGSRLSETTEEPRVRGVKVIRLNVGGKFLSIRCDTITNLNARLWSPLLSILSGRWNDRLIKDTCGRIFLDLDLRWVEPIFDSLRASSSQPSFALPINPCMTSPKESSLGLYSVIFKNHMEGLFQQRTLLSSVSTIECLNSWYVTFKLKSFLPASLEGPDVRLKLLYRGSRDGFDAIAFHKACDGKPNTVSVIEDDQGNVFGGFADVASGRASRKFCSSAGNVAFLFSLLTNSSRGLAPMKFPLYQQYDKAIYNHPSCLCSFGAWGDSDLHIESNSNGILGGYTSLGGAYSDLGQGELTLTNGHKFFLVHEIEVYVVDTSARILHECSPTAENVVEQAIAEHSSSQLQTVSERIDKRFSQISKIINQQIVDMYESVDREELELLQEVRFMLHLDSSENVLTAIQTFTRSSINAAPDSECRPRKRVRRKETNPNNANEDNDHGSETLQEIEECLDQLRALAERKRCPEANSVKEEDVVVSFNVNGTIISTLRSTILLAAPDSFLARRLSGLWTEQRDDVDEDGNILQDVHLASFVRIINYLRLRMLLGDITYPVNKILVPRCDESLFKELLAYYCMPEVPYEVAN